MSIGPDDVRHVAQLAELEIAEDDIPALAEQLEGIVAFVGQLSELDLPLHEAPINLGPAQVALREDVVAPIPMVRGPGATAPVFEQGFFVVPRLGGMADE
jgi:aspartyl-tRNA(Asn)/glutamyl-tRNA(Gln) amidotransferase subunit C